MSSRGPLSFDPSAAAAKALGLAVSQLDGAALERAAEAAWERLDAAGRAAIAAVVELGGSAAAAVLEEETAAMLELDGLAPAAARKEARRALEASWEAGLLSRDRASRTFYALPEVAEAFAPLARRDLESRLPAIPAPAPPRLDEHLACCAINLLRHDPLKLTREGTPFRRGLEAIAERLGALLPRGRGGAKDAVARVETLVETLRDLGLLRTVREALEVDPDAVLEWSSLDEASRAALLLPQDPEHPALRLLRLVLELGPDRAWASSMLGRALRRGLAATSDDDPAEPVLRGAASQDLASAILALERASLLGAAPGVEGAFALTATGRSFPMPPEIPRPKGVHVGHDLSALVPRGIPASMHARLGDVAVLESADQVARYRLDRGAVLESLDRGLLPGELELFLAEIATPVLPDAVRDDLRRWSERFGEVTSRAGICVSCSAPKRHEEFDAIARRSGLSIAVVAPGVAVVAPEDHAAFANLLAAAGLTPRRRVQPLPRGPSSAVPSREPVPPLASDAASASAARRRVSSAALAAAMAAMPRWASRFRDEAARVAAPPPTLVASQVKEKYRREFGSGQLAALDALDVDELIHLEDKGLVRQYLAGKIPAPSAQRPAADLDEYLGDDMVSVTPARARQVMEQAAKASLTCQLAYLQGPGRTQKLIVSPIELVTDGAGAYVRARLPGSSQERMLATDRIHALRVMRR